jgi:hypothetical protein
MNEKNFVLKLVRTGLMDYKPFVSTSYVNNFTEEHNSFTYGKYESAKKFSLIEAINLTLKHLALYRELLTIEEVKE